MVSRSTSRKAACCKLDDAFIVAGLRATARRERSPLLTIEEAIDLVAAAVKANFKAWCAASAACRASIAARPDNISRAIAAPALSHI